MKLLVLLQNSGFFTELSNRFNEGGPFFMSLILICLILALAFLVFGFLNVKKDFNKSKKMTSLASDVSILGLVFGLLGSIIGMINVFDAIDGGGMGTSMSGHLKIALLTALFGAITFVLPRIGIIILKALQKS